MQPEQTFMTMTEVVGHNTRTVRAVKSLSQEQLRVGLAERGIRLSRPTLSQLEGGKRPISVDELLALAFVLGVAPQLLLYPPRGTRVGTSEEVAFPGWLLASWMWDPDEKVASLSHARLRERRLLLDALDLDEQLSDDDVTRLAHKALAAVDETATDTEAPVSEMVTDKGPFVSETESATDKPRKSTRAKRGQQSGGRAKGKKR